MILIASFSVHLFPTETKTGLTFARVLKTAPIVSFLSFSRLYVPFSSGGSSKVPVNLLFAQPTVGLSSNRPRCAARPSRRGWAMECAEVILASVKENKWE